jgi:DNA-binding NarL/FixJ family response regulator
MAVKLIIADGHKMMRDGIASILRENSHYRVVAEAGSGPEVLRLWRACQPRIAILALRLPGLNGIETTRALLRLDPGARIVLLAADDDPPLLHLALGSGAHAVLSRLSTRADLFSALDACLLGGSFFQVPTTAASPSASGALDALSPRERQVLRLVAEGKSSKEIAQFLNLELETIRSYRKAMMRKMGATNAAEVTRAAVLAGLVPPSAAAVSGEG